MALRVTADEVHEIIEVDKSVANLKPFIRMANLLVTDTLGGEGLSAALMKEIERNMAAHFICMIDPRTTEEWNDDIKVKYSGKYGEGLKSTPYGQAALTMDPTAKLSNLGKQRASLGVVDYSTDTTS